MQWGPGAGYIGTMDTRSPPHSPLSPSPGDMVVLGSHDGLGRGHFLVLRVDLSPRGGRDMEVMALNGSVWYGRSQGSQVVSRPEAP